MAVINDGIKNFTSGEALAVYRRVMINSSGNAVYADAKDKSAGITEEAVASGYTGAIRLHNVSGTRKVVAAGAFSAYDTVYGAANGMVDDDPVGEVVGFALEAATALNDIIEIIPGDTVSEAAGSVVEVTGGSGGITAWDSVYISDQTDNVLTVLPAQADSASSLADYICPSAIAEGATGLAFKYALRSGINTSAGSVNDPVYLSDATAGAYTLTKPTGTDQVQIIGRIREDHASTGAIAFDMSSAKQIVHDHSDNSEGGDLGDHASGDITLGDGKNIVTNTTTGSKIGAAAAQKVSFWNATPVVQPTHNADPAACASMTQSAAPTTITDSSGLDGTHDDTVGAITDIDTLTDSTGGAADDTVSPLVAIADTSMVAINGSGMTTAQEAEYDTMVGEVNTAIGIANDNFKEVTDQLITQKTLNGVLAQNQSDLAQKLIEIVADLAEIRVDTAAAKTAIDANNAVIDAINADFATTGLTASS